MARQLTAQQRRRRDIRQAMGIQDVRKASAGQITAARKAGALPDRLAARQAPLAKIRTPPPPPKQRPPGVPPGYPGPAGHERPIPRPVGRTFGPGAPSGQITPGRPTGQAPYQGVVKNPFAAEASFQFQPNIPKRQQDEVVNQYHGDVNRMNDQDILASWRMAGRQGSPAANYDLLAAYAKTGKAKGPLAKRLLGEYRKYKRPGY